MDVDVDVDVDVHCYESFIVLSSREGPEQLGNGAHWVKVSLMSLQDQPELKMNPKNIMNLTDIEEIAEQKLERNNAIRNSVLY